MNDREELEAAIPRAEPRMQKALDRATSLLEVEGIEGVGQGETADGDPCVVVMVSVRTAEVDRHIPASIEGFPVEIMETGTFTAGG